MRTGYGTLRFENSDSCSSWIWSLSWTLWLFTSSDFKLRPHIFTRLTPPSRSRSLLSKKLPHNSTYSLLGLLLYPGTPPFSPLLKGNKNWNMLKKQDHRSRLRWSTKPAPCQAALAHCSGSWLTPLPSERWPARLDRGERWGARI